MISEAQSEHSQKSKIAYFAKIANGFRVLNFLPNALFYMFDWFLNTPLYLF